MFEYFLKRYERKLAASVSSQLRSSWLRERFYERYKIKVGMYSYGVFDPVRINPGVTIGRYCSVADTVRVFRRNHGVSTLSTHPFFYNSALGMVSKDTIEFAPLVIEDDVWIGHNATILPSVSRIGRGAVIGAGSIVVKDVPCYTVWAGNPAKKIRDRFSAVIIERVEASKWWEMDEHSLRCKLNSKPDCFYTPTLNDLDNFWIDND